MHNLSWYICLAILGVGSTAYTVYINRDIYKVSTLLVFYLYIAGFTWICEFIVLGLFNSYAYKTGLLSDPWAQNLLGHLILNTSLYPAAGIIMVVHSRRYLWISIFAAFFTLIEYLFVNLRLYEQHWWRYYMTILTVIILLSITGKWFDKINQSCYGFIRAITYYFVAMLIIHLPAPILLLSGKQYYKLSLVNNFFINSYRSSLAIIFFYHMIEAFILVLFTVILKKWYYRLLPFIISLVAQIIFAKVGILIIEDGWNFIYTLFIYEIFIAIFILIEKHTLKRNISFIA